ncbi:lysine-specific demethylase 3B, partial [Blyttiomyces helicus]
LQRWLVHWTVMGFFTAFEILGDALVFWVPGYYEAKLVFVLWLVNPYSEGSWHIYRLWLQPTLERHERDIDRAIDDA